MRYTLLLTMSTLRLSDVGGADYSQFNPYNDGLRADTINNLTFQTMGNNDAHILLQNNNTDFNKSVVEIVIGGFGNRLSVIRDQQQGPALSNYSGSLLSGCSFEWFWISWTGGCVKIGKGSAVGDSKIMEWCELSFPINGIRFSYGYGSGGTFIIPIRLADVEFTASKNDVKFVNIERPQTILINVQLADNQTVAYIRLFINDTTENHATIIFGRSHVEVMLCNSENCTHNNRTTEPTNQLPQTRMLLKNAHALVIQDLFQWRFSTRTIFNQCGNFYFTNLALSSITGLATFTIAPQQDIAKHFENNSKEQIEFTHVMFPSTTPLIDQPKGSPPPTAPLKEYPGLTPVVPIYRNSLAKSMPRSYDERSKRSTSSSGESNSSVEEECFTDCYCPCGWVVEPKNYTPNEIANKVAAIQERLKVDRNKLASTQRTLNSVPDNRSSAKAVGLVGMIFLVLILGAIFVFDIGNIIRDLKTLRDNLRQGCGCKEASLKPSRVASPHDTVEQSTTV